MRSTHADCKRRRNEDNRAMAAAKKAAGIRNTATTSVTKLDFEARLAEIPPDTRTLTQRLCGDPIPNDPRRFGRQA